MVKAFLFITILIPGLARADFFGFGSNNGIKSKIPELVEKIKSLDQSTGPAFEDNFNQLVKNIENSMEEERLICSGDSSSGTSPMGKDQKQLCFRELKNNYLEAMDVIFSQKKKYLELIYSKQVERLGEVQKKLKEDIEKSF